MIPKMWDESKQLVVFLTQGEFVELATRAYNDAVHVCRQRIVDEWPYQRQDLEKEVAAHPDELPAILRMLEEQPYLDAPAFFHHLLEEVASRIARHGASQGRSLSAEICVDGSVAFVAAAPQTDAAGIISRAHDAIQHAE